MLLVFLDTTHKAHKQVVFQKGNQNFQRLVTTNPSRKILDIANFSCDVSQLASQSINPIHSTGPFMALN